MRTALIQMTASMRRGENLDRAEELLREAARDGVKVACLQECFATWFFAQRIDPAAQDPDRADRRADRDAHARARQVARPDPHRTVL